MDLEPIRARAHALRRHPHPIASLSNRHNPECTACQFRVAAQMLNDRDVRLALLLSDAMGDRDRLIARVTELEAALGDAVERLGSLVGVLEKVA